MELDNYNKRRLTQKYILWLTLITVAGGWAVALLLYFALPRYYPLVYPYILVYFYLWGLGFLWMLNRPVRNHQAAAHGFLLFKVAKLVVSIGIVGTYIWLSDLHANPFVLSFLFFYMVYLFFETRFFLIYEKNRKEAKKKGKA